MAEIHSFDPLEGLNSSDHIAPALFKLKEIVQIIYEKDYRFAQPPKTPTLTASPGDGYVMLSWNDDADKLTRDPFLGNINDFEGYQLQCCFQMVKYQDLYQELHNHRPLLHNSMFSHFRHFHL